MGLEGVGKQGGTAAGIAVDQERIEAVVVLIHQLRKALHHQQMRDLPNLLALARLALLSVLILMAVAVEVVVMVMMVVRIVVLVVRVAD